MKPVEIKLPFGLNADGILVHIADVESGKGCGCFCPSCRSPLVAAKGPVRQHHFRHDVEIDCVIGLESAIHLAAKKILKEKMHITLPEYVAAVTKEDSRGEEYTEQETVVTAGKVVRFDNVQEEIEMHGMIPDILAATGGKSLIIEIFYRHKVDDKKLEKIIQANISAIEINLSDLKPDDVKDWEAFWSFMNDPERVQWLYNAKARDSVYPKLEIKLTKKVEAQELVYKQEEIAKQKQAEREKVRLKEALKDYNLHRSAEIRAQLSANAENHPGWQHTKQYLPYSWDALPDFLKADVANGDWIYGCDKSIWQAAFYSFFICKSGKRFCIKIVDDWLQNTVKCKVPSNVKTVGIYGRRYPELLPADLSGRLPSTWRTLQEYFFQLCYLGMIEMAGEDWQNPGNYWFQVVSKDPVNPPRYPRMRVEAA